MCTYNAEIAAKANKKDHLNTWMICKLISDPILNSAQNSSDTSLMEFPWPKHPFNGSLIESFIDYYLSVFDFQMAAMLICCFESFCPNCKRFACSGKNCQITGQTNNEQEKKSKLSCQPKVSEDFLFFILDRNFDVIIMIIINLSKNLTIDAIIL